MVDNIGPADAVAGAPSYSGRKLRQLGATALAGATSTRPLGARSGVRPGTPATTVTATSSTWTVQPFAGIADVMTASEAGPYEFAFDAVATGSVDAAAGSARKDIIYVEVKDPAEGIGTTPTVTRKYLAGTPSGSPVAPTIPVGERGFVVAEINVPASGGGSPTVSWVAPYSAAAGAVIPFLTKAQMDAVTNYAVGTYADVFADPTPANNTLYRWSGSGWKAPVEDTGWTVCTPESAFYNIVTLGDDRALSVRRIGKVVRIEGHISTDAGTAAGSVWAFIPAGYRPAKNAWVWASPDGSGTSILRAFVASDGDLTFASGVGSATSVIVSGTYFIE